MSTENCLCDYDPHSKTYGPAQDCPEHGDVRLYAHWVELLRAERDALRAQVEAVRALADEDAHHLRSGVVGMVRLSDLRAALSSPEQAS